MATVSVIQVVLPVSIVAVSAEVPVSYDVISVYPPEVVSVAVYGVVTAGVLAIYQRHAKQ